MNRSNPDFEFSAAAYGHNLFTSQLSSRTDISAKL